MKRIARLVCGVIWICGSSLWADASIPTKVLHPRAVKLELSGEEPYSGKHLLVAGHYATATIMLKDYHPEYAEWGEYDEDGVGQWGHFRHKLSKIRIGQFAAVEISNPKVPYTNDLLRASFVSAATNNFEYVIEGDSLPDPVPCSSPLGDSCYQLTVRFKLEKGDGAHGKFFWTVVTEAELEGDESLRTGDGLTFGPWDFTDGWSSESPADDDNHFPPMSKYMLVMDESGWVFFDKDEKDDRKNPNWYTYWKADGAVPQLSEVEYERVPTGYCTLFARGGEREVAFVEGDGWGHCILETGRIQIHEAAGDAHFFAKRSGQGWVYEARTKPPANSPVSKFWDDREYGIYTVQNVIAHETEHKRLYDEYWTEVGLHSSYEDRERLFDRDIELIERTWKGIVWAKIVGKDEIYYEGVHCDWLTDKMETQTYGSFGLSPYCLDTMCLQVYKDEPYKYTGDNEFLAMQAGYDANFKHSRVVDEKDWAFPGQQSFIPRPFVKMKSPKASSEKVSALRSVAAAEVRASEVVENQPSEGEMTCLSIEQNLVPAVSGVKYSGVEYSLKFDVKGTNKVEFIAYLSDLNSNLVAATSVAHEFGSSEFLVERLAS